MKNFTGTSGSLGVQNACLWPGHASEKVRTFRSERNLIPDMQKTARSELLIVLIRSSRAAIFKTSSQNLMVLKVTGLHSTAAAWLTYIAQRIQPSRRLAAKIPQRQAPVVSRIRLPHLIVRTTTSAAKSSRKSKTFKSPLLFSGPRGCGLADGIGRRGHRAVRIAGLHRNGFQRLRRADRDRP